MPPPPSVLKWGLTDQEIADALQLFAPTNQRMQLIEKWHLDHQRCILTPTRNSMRAAIGIYQIYLRREANCGFGRHAGTREFSDSEHAIIGENDCVNNVDILFTYGTAAVDPMIPQSKLQGDSLLQNGAKATRNWSRIKPSLIPGDALLLKGSRECASRQC